MRSATDITIQRAIIHGINPHVADGFVLSEASMPIRKDEPVAKFLSNHIQNGLGDRAIRAGRFQDGDDSQVELYRLLLLGRKNFVKSSQAIATTLHDIMKRDKRISVGTLVVCFFNAANHIDVKRYLAVLKLDQGDAFQTTTATDQKGRQYITFSEIVDIMPTTRERLQKCAFIRPLEPRPGDFDLMVLDRQHAMDEPAQFFTEAFLKATLASDPATHTRQFHKSAFSGLNSVRDKLTTTAYGKVRNAINSAVHAQSIDIDDWANKLGVPKVAREAVLNAVRTVIPDASFETDPVEADRLTRKLVIRGRHDLRITFESAYEREIVRSRKRKSDPNKGNYVEIVLHVHDYHEESK